MKTQLKGLSFFLRCSAVTFVMLTLTSCSLSTKPISTKTRLNEAFNMKAHELFSWSSVTPRFIRLDTHLVRFIEIPSKASSGKTIGSTQQEVPWLFIHGIGGSMHNFEKIIERTSEKHRVIALDLPGFGGSISFVEEYSIERYADMIRDFIKASRFKEFHLICHSMGGQVCISLSLKDPSALKSITLIDTAGTYERSDFVEKIAKRLGKINIGVTSVEGGVSLADLTWYDQSFMKRFISPEPLFIMAMESYRTNFRDRIKELSIPPLIIWGMDDPIFPVPIAFHLKENIKGAILYLVKDAGHSPQVSHPDLVYHWIEKYHLERSKTSPL